MKKKQGSIGLVSAVVAVLSLLAGLLWGSCPWLDGSQTVFFCVLAYLLGWLAVALPILLFLFAFLWLIFIRPSTIRCLWLEQTLRMSEAWKELLSGIQGWWREYEQTLALAFARMDLQQQWELKLRVSQIITVGTGIITMSAWYWFMPQQTRVILLPMVLVGSWWAGTKVAKLL